MGITHTFVSTVEDGSDASLVRPSNWNAAHTVTPDTIANILSDHNKTNHDSLAIDHTSLTNKGTNTHSQIDTHIAATTGTHGINALNDGSNKVILNGTIWEFWVGSVRVGYLDANGNLHIKGLIITEDGGV